MRKLIFTGILAALLIYGCSDGTPLETKETPPAVVPEIQPLVVGNSWTYIDSIFTSGTVRIDTTYIKIEGKDTLASIPGGPVVYFWDVYSTLRLLRRNLIAVTGEGIIHYAEINGQDTLLLKKQWVKYPAEVGDKFEEPRFNYDERTRKYTYDKTWVWTLTGTSQQLGPGDQLKCYVYKAVPDDSTEIYLYYALNKGYVGWKTVINGSTVFSEALYPDAFAVARQNKQQ